ncbi:hypothetical protein ACXC9Q_36110 [Kribbella sp. CWNU-51]
MESLFVPRTTVLVRRSYVNQPPTWTGDTPDVMVQIRSPTCSATLLDVTAEAGPRVVTVVSVKSGIAA